MTPALTQHTKQLVCCDKQRSLNKLQMKASQKQEILAISTLKQSFSCFQVAELSTTDNVEVETLITSHFTSAEKFYSFSHRKHAHLNMGCAGMSSTPQCCDFKADYSLQPSSPVPELLRTATHNSASSTRGTLYSTACPNSEGSGLDLFHLVEWACFLGQLSRSPEKKLLDQLAQCQLINYQVGINQSPLC